MSWLVRGVVVVGVGLGLGCTDAETIFTEGRIENRCNGSIPVCGTQAGCVLGDDQYLRGRFPGGQRVVVRTQTDETRIVAQFLLEGQTFPGSEIVVRAHDMGCGDYDEGHSKDVDLFELAGDDGILMYELDVEGRGDHYVEFFSDMGSGFLFKVTLEE